MGSSKNHLNNVNHEGTPSFWDQKWDASVIYCPQAQNPGRPHQERCAQKLGARWHEIDTGHYPMLTTPDELARLIAEG